MALALPFLVLAAIELGLRWFGYGYDTGFLREQTVDGQRFLETNPRFGWRYFPPAVARTPQPLWVPAEKPPGTLRVVVLGESAAMGDPEPAYGLPRVLDALLGEALPGRQVEVINAAATAINSHALVAMARDCRALQADYWVIYLGNNEVVGPFGAGTVFGPRAPSRTLIRAMLGLRSLRLGQAAEAARRALLPGEPASWEGMELFLEHRVAAEDPQLEVVYQHFEANLREMLRIGAGSGARVFLCTVGVNARDCAPFASLHPPALTEEQRAQAESLRRAALEAIAQGRHAAAEGHCTEALALSPRHAELHYLRALCRLEAGQMETARADLTAALQHDALRFRADTWINEIIRTVGRQYAGQGVVVVDAAERLAFESPMQLPGREFFWEHVHLTLEGNYVAARVVAEAMFPATPASGREWPPIQAVARRLAWTEWDRYQVTEQVRRRLEQPPFTAQASHARQMHLLTNLLASLETQITPAALREQADVYRQIIAGHPRDWVLRARFAELLDALGEADAAAAQWQEVLRCLPRYAEAHYRLGNLADKAGQPETAERHFRAALQLRPEAAESWNGLGLSLLAQNRAAEAEAALRQALRLRPRFPVAAVNLALALNRQDRRAEGREQFRAALRQDPNNVAAHVNLGKMLKEDGQTEAALAHYRRAAQLRPGDAVVRFNLANTLADLQLHAEALEHYAAAAASAPDMVEARLNYGLELARAGREDEALDQLREAARRGSRHYEARVNYGVALARRRQWAEAREEFAAAAALRPQDPAPLVNLGMVLARMNLRNSAREALEAALRLDPAHRAARQQLELLEQRPTP